MARHVVVTTEHRGVFFGDMVEKNGDTATLKDCRMCLYWPAEVKGVVGLSVTGPLKGSRVGPAAPTMELMDITAVMDCTPEAVKAWESEPWDE